MVRVFEKIPRSTIIIIAWIFTVGCALPGLVKAGSGEIKVPDLSFPLLLQFNCMQIYATVA